MFILKLVGKFAAHTFVGTALFLLMAAPAVGLDVLVSWLSVRLHLDGFIVVMLHGTEFALLTVDALLLVAHEVKGLFDALRELAKQ